MSVKAVVAAFNKEKALVGAWGPLSDNKTYNFAKVGFQLQRAVSGGNVRVVYKALSVSVQPRPSLQRSHYTNSSVQGD